MIPFEAQEFAYRLGSPERSGTENFTVYTGLMDIPETDARVQTAILYEDLDIGRKEVIYDVSYNRTAQQLKLVPRTFTITSPVDTTIDTFFIVDGPLNTEDRIAISSTTGTNLTFSNGVFYPLLHIFADENNPTNFGLVTVPGTGSVTVNTAMADTNLISAGRYLLATYKNSAPISVPANTPIAIQLGTITFQFE